MENIVLHPIGWIHNEKGRFWIAVLPEYRKGLLGLDEFSEIMTMWWAHMLDYNTDDKPLVITKPYTKGPEELGVFATRSQIRPNSVGISMTSIKSIDLEKGIIELYYIDAMDQTPLLDIKPYMPSNDRVENPTMPVWCSHWPNSYEESGYFDWESEFNF